MKVYLLSDEVLLFEGLGWGIIEDNTAQYSKVYGTHQTCAMERDTPAKEGKIIYGEYCWVPDDEPVCTNCDEDVPAEIQALIILKTWDD